MTRIRFRVLGERLSMPEEWWESLKQRFDAKNAVLIIKSHRSACVDKRWRISVPCPWCLNRKKTDSLCLFHKKCDGCVFYKFRVDDFGLRAKSGCINLLQQFMEKEYGVKSYNGCIGEILRLDERTIEWTRGVDEEARRILFCIQKELNEIEARRKE